MHEENLRHIVLQKGVALRKFLFDLTHRIIQREEGGEEYDGGDASKDYQDKRFHYG